MKNQNKTTVIKVAVATLAFLLVWIAVLITILEIRKVPEYRNVLAHTAERILGRGLDYSVWEMRLSGGWIAKKFYGSSILLVDYAVLLL